MEQMEQMALVGGFSVAAVADGSRRLLSRCGFSVARQFSRQRIVRSRSSGRRGVRGAELSGSVRARRLLFDAGAPRSRAADVAVLLSDEQAEAQTSEQSVRSERG